MTPDTSTEGRAVMLRALDNLTHSIGKQTARMLAGDLPIADYHAWFLRDVRPVADALAIQFDAVPAFTAAQRAQIDEFRRDLHSTVQVIRTAADEEPHKETTP